MYDFLVPLYGTEHFNSVKETNNDPGSVSIPIKNNSLKTEKEALSQLKQEGFGNLETSSLKEIDDEGSSQANSDNKIKKLGSIYEAMKKATVQTSELKYKPKKEKITGPKKMKKNKFHLV